MLWIYFACTSQNERFSLSESKMFVDNEDDTNALENTGLDETESIPYPFVNDETDQGVLTNTSFVLEEVLEYGLLNGACDLYKQFPQDHDLKLRCGKEMFFYEGFDGIGIPQPLFDFVNTKFSEDIGIGFTEYGMILDPYSVKNRPIGYGQGAKVGGTETLAYSCASCHFGQLPDGRYSVGMANYNYEAGKQFLALMLLPQSVMPGFNDAHHDEDALAIIEPMRQKLWNSPLLFMQMGWDLLPLLWNSELSAETITAEIEGQYASWRSGTMDVFIPPLPIDDQVHVVTKIPSLWSIPTEEERLEFEMTSTMLAWNGGSPHLQHFLKGFLSLGDVSNWTSEDVEPLIAYIETLTAPTTLSDLDVGSVDRGRVLFELECLDCHRGFQGSGIEIFSFDEIGTDPQLMYILDRDLDGYSDFEIDAEPTHGIKAPRLTGVWAKKRLLHNGSVDSLEDLFCMYGERRDDQPIFGNIGHEYGCDLSSDEKMDIIAFLQSI